MRAKSTFAPAIAAIILVLLAGCALPPSKARLYNMGNDMLSTARLYQLDRRYGIMDLRLPEGQQLHGEFTLTREHTPADAVPDVVRLRFSADAPPSPDPLLSGLPASAKPDSLAAAYGFKAGADARPAAVATAVDKRGTALEIVFYTLDIKRHRGTGVAHDNRGNWYLVRLGI